MEHEQVGRPPPHEPPHEPLGEGGGAESTSGVADAPGTRSGGDTGSGDQGDPLLALRAALDEVDELPLEARAEVFERTHQVVVDELRALELG